MGKWENQCCSVVASAHHFLLLLFFLYLLYYYHHCYHLLLLRSAPFFFFFFFLLLFLLFFLFDGRILLVITPTAPSPVKYIPFPSIESVYNGKDISGFINAVYAPGPEKFLFLFATCSIPFDASVDVSKLLHRT